MTGGDVRKLRFMTASGQLFSIAGWSLTETTEATGSARCYMTAMKHLLLPFLLIACGDKETDDSGVVGTDDTGTTDTTAPDLPDYSLTGAYAVGTYDETITGSTGESLQVQIWYPADEAGTEAVVYDSLYEAGTATTDAVPNCGESRPVMLFSHGYGGIRWQSIFLMEHLASHGYIVVAPNHTHNTFLDDDGDLFEEVLLRRPVDIADSFDWAASLAMVDGCIDSAAGYSVSGHSFGGYTAYATGGATLTLPDSSTQDLSDDRVWAVVPLAPWHAYVLEGGGTADITVPVLTLSGTRDETTTWDEVTAMHGALTTTPRYLGEFPDAGHYTFSPMACDFGLTGDGCGGDFLDLDTATGLTQTAVLAFLEESRGVTGAISQLPESSALVWDATE